MESHCKAGMSVAAGCTQHKTQQTPGSTTSSACRGLPAGSRFAAIPRTRDKSGKYIPGSNAAIYRADPVSVHKEESRGSFRDSLQYKKCTTDDPSRQWLSSSSDDEEDQGGAEDAACANAPPGNNHHNLLSCSNPTSKRSTDEKCMQQQNRRHQRRDEGPGFCYSLSALLSDNHSTVALPAACQKNVKSVTVSNATVFVNDRRFPDATVEGCDDRGASNEIRFSEGFPVVNQQHVVKLSIGACFDSPLTWTPVQAFELLYPEEDCRQPSGAASSDPSTLCSPTEIKILAKDHRVCLEAEEDDGEGGAGCCTQDRPLVFLLETFRYHPSAMQFVPFRVSHVIDQDNLLLTPCPQPATDIACSQDKQQQNNKKGQHNNNKSCKPSSKPSCGGDSSSSARIKCFGVLIPTDFCPDTMLILPPLDEIDVAVLLNKLLSDSCCFRWDCRTREYVVEQCFPSARLSRVSKLWPDDSSFFLARLSPKRYCDAKDLVPEIQRSMNPPFVTEGIETLTVDGKRVCISVGEYSTPCDLAREIQTKINNTLCWAGTFTEVLVNYDCENGRFVFSRVAPFWLELAPCMPGCGDDEEDDTGCGVARSSLAELLGFSTCVLSGNKEYVSNFQVYYVTRENWNNNNGSAGGCCSSSTSSTCNDKLKTAYVTHDHCLPNNRYVVAYDQCNDMISVRASSKADYTKLLTLSPDPPCCYKFTTGHNFVIPFRFLCDSPVTVSLDFVQKGCHSLEWISAVGASCLVKPPPLLFVSVAELENDLFVTNATFGGNGRGANQGSSSCLCCDSHRQRCGGGYSTANRGRKEDLSSSWQHCCSGFLSSSSDSRGCGGGYSTASGTGHAVSKYVAVLQSADCGSKYSLVYSNSQSTQTGCIQESCFRCTGVTEVGQGCGCLRRRQIKKNVCKGDCLQKLTVTFYDDSGRTYNMCGKRALLNFCICG